MVMNKGHLQLQASPHCRPGQLCFKRRSPACSLLLTTPLFFMVLCFVANKVLNTGDQRAAEVSSPCFLRASSHDQLPPTKDLSHLIPSASQKESKSRNQTQEEKQLDSHEYLTTSFPKACKDKLIYIYPLPPQFNEELVERCKVGYKRYCDKWFCIPCNCLENYGFGPRVTGNQTMVSKGELSKGEYEEVRLIPENAWYRSDQFSVEVIFYEKMKTHKCVTNNAREANAFYIPFLGGIDVSFVSFSQHTHIRDELTQRLVGWLSGNPIWQAHKEAPHFMVLGHVAWDFDRKLLEGDGFYEDGSTTWGTSLFHQPLLSNVTWLLPERKITQHDMGVPFPTLFHPSSFADLSLWQEEVRKAKRPWLVTFVGGSTRKFTGGNTRSLRIELMKQCNEVDKEGGNLTSNTIQRCRAVECISGHEMTRKRNDLELNKGERSVIENEIACGDEPEEVVRALASSVFCLQPKGDSATRKGFFDTIVAGCIPVLFSNATAYLQYKWHLPVSSSLYSIFIPEDDILANRVNVVDTLSRIPLTQIKAMQQTIIQLIPSVVYSPPSSTLHDAFSIILDSLFSHKNM